jgi:hypothetical protein
MHLSLETENKNTAAQRAADIYISLRANGWEQTLQKFRKTKAEKQVDVTVGEFLQAVRKNCRMEDRTRTGYETCLRRIVSDVFKIQGDRYDYRAGGRDAWIQKVEARKLAELTPEKVKQWQIKFLNDADPDPISQRRAKVSCNTALRQAKSLFSAKVLAALETIVELPTPLPFSKVEYSERQSLKYQGGLDIEALVGCAESELAESSPEQFKIFLLGCMAGLRRREIDLLEWSSFHWDAQEIEIKATRYFQAKSEDSYGKVQVEPELIEAFRGYRARSSGDFVIESDRPAKLASWNRYRCQPHFKALIAWLRAKGIEDDKPIHTLRKEFGSAINAHGNIHAASAALRHADIGITAQFYADKRERVTTGFGRHLKPTNVVRMEGVA